MPPDTISLVLCLLSIVLFISTMIIQRRTDRKLTAQWQADYKAIQQRADERVAVMRARAKLGVEDPDQAS